VIRTSALRTCGGLQSDLGPFADGYLTRKIALSHGYYYAPEPVATWTILSDSFSNAAALNPGRALALRSKAHERLSADPIFPPWYADRFVDRLRFATARLALQQKPIDVPKVIKLGARSRIDRLVIKFVLTISTGLFGRVMSTAWLHLRLRPFRLTNVAASFVHRKILGRTYRGNQSISRAVGYGNS
jgi:hypothetical protein